MEKVRKQEIWLAGIRKNSSRNIDGRMLSASGQKPSSGKHSVAASSHAGENLPEFYRKICRLEAMSEQFKPCGFNLGDTSPKIIGRLRNLLPLLGLAMRKGLSEQAKSAEKQKSNLVDQAKLPKKIDEAFLELDSTRSPEWQLDSSFCTETLRMFSKMLPALSCIAVSF